MSSIRHILHRATSLPGVQQHLVVGTRSTRPPLIPSLSQPTSTVPIPGTANPSLTQSRQRSNRSRRGLYDGRDIRSGNSISFSNKKTKRKFKPNVFKKRLYSEILDEMIQFHLTTSALRTVDKVGGLDNYLLTTKHATSGEGLVVKQRILQKIAHSEKMGKDIFPTITLPKKSSVASDAGAGVE